MWVQKKNYGISAANSKNGKNIVEKYTREKEGDKWDAKNKKKRDAVTVTSF